MNSMEELREWISLVRDLALLFPLLGVIYTPSVFPLVRTLEPWSVMIKGVHLFKVLRSLPFVRYGPFLALFVL
jgi:hypothetical protein